MKKLIGLLVIWLILIGCGGYNQLLKEIPLAEFKSFTYHRAGNMSSATINVKGASIKDQVIHFDDVHITADYGPFVNFDIQLIDYTREISIIEKNRGRGR